MKKTVFKFISVMMIFIILSIPVFSNFSAAQIEENPTIDSVKVLETRLLNMLNHNFVYGEDFNNIEGIVNNSAVAILDMIDDEGFIPQSALNEYLFDMYGFKIEDFSNINKDFGYKEGYVYILPRGYTIYNHKAISLKENEDGTVTLVTNVIIKNHDSSAQTLTAETIFVKNPASVFGYNIVISEIN